MSTIQGTNSEKNIPYEIPGPVRPVYGRSCRWNENVEYIITQIKNRDFFPSHLKRLAVESEEAHNLYLSIRIDPEVAGEVAKKKFLKAEEEERKLVLKLKKEFHSWYDKRDKIERFKTEVVRIVDIGSTKNAIIYKISAAFDEIRYSHPQNPKYETWARYRVDY